MTDDTRKTENARQRKEKEERKTKRRRCRENQISTSHILLLYYTYYSTSHQKPRTSTKKLVDFSLQIEISCPYLSNSSLSVCAFALPFAILHLDFRGVDSRPSLAILGHPWPFLAILAIQ